MNHGARRVAVLGGSRIPFERRNGAYAEAGNQDMLTAALDALVSRFGLAGEVLGEVAAGAVLKHSRDFKELGERGSGRGVISICAGGGLGVTAILEAA